MSYEHNRPIQNKKKNYMKLSEFKLLFSQKASVEIHHFINCNFIEVNETFYAFVSLTLNLNH